MQYTLEEYKDKIMKKLIQSAVASIGLILCVSCTQDHLIGDRAEREAVQADFEARCESLSQGDLFQIFDSPMSNRQREAMTFLYAYMPLSDIAGHPGEFFLENVDYAFKAREEMPWGKDIPEREFRHFVLPPRVNNENLDGCRKVFYEELKGRIEHLSLYDAVLEVNHWCHEKVNYRPSDGRTSSPLASIKTAYGRCGEESTFTVAALRAVGIPARQVYTPRWAHTDDNHAWVEAWVDGKWYFLGACEPEPVLNLGWFNAPASRGMLMHTKVFGRYNGPEEVMYRTPRYTEINVIDNYAPTARVHVTVVDAEGKSVEGARVEFKVYNYAEFYTVASKLTDAEGRTFLTAGKGDMVVWASKEGLLGYQQHSFGKADSLTVVLDKRVGESYTLDLDIVPPVEGANMPEVTPEQRAENDRRFAREDSIRNVYVATFITENEARAFAQSHRYNPDEVSSLLLAARGNYQTLCDFLAALPDSLKTTGVALLQEVSAKDLRDVSLDVLNDHVLTKPCAGFDRYVRNPRVSNEMIVPYKKFFSQVVSPERAEAWRADPMALVAWVADSIRVDKDCNLGGSPITPVGVWKARTADAHSRDIFFVSLSRSVGIPARIDEVTGKVQLMDCGGVVDVDFEAREQTGAPTGKLKARYTPIKSMSDPKYYYHFTLSKITPEGTLQLLNYDETQSSWSNMLRQGLTLDAGDYMMVTGTRLAKGGVLAQATFLTIHPDKTTTIDLVMRESREEIQVIGNFNSESTYWPVGKDAPVSVLSTTGRGYYVVAVLGAGQEPTNHALRDIAALGPDFEAWGRRLVLLFPNEEQYRKFNAAEFPGLPATISYGIDVNGSIQQQIVADMELRDRNALPLFIIGDTFNRVVFVSQGYTIGVGEQLMKVIHKL